MPVILLEAYRPRPVIFLEIWPYAGWRMKVYGIAYGRPRPDAVLVDAAKRIAEARLPLPAESDTRYGVGFIGVHQGRGSTFVFVDWWAEENELYHHVYVAPNDHPSSLEYRTPSGLTACVWDLAVMSFERQAWVEHVLANPAGPDIEAYLRHRMEGEV